MKVLLLPVAAAAVVLASLSPLMAQPAFNQYSTNVFWQSGGFDCRVLMVGPQGRIWVGVADGSIRILEDNNQDGVADNIKVFTGGVFSPHGLTWKANGTGWDIFVAHLTAPFGGTGQITRFADPDGDDVPNTSNTIVLAMPTGSHQVNNLKVDPTGNWLYFGQGALSDTAAGTGALIGRVSPTASNLLWGDAQIEIFATGLRNSWGLEFHPGGELFCTDTGRDDLGPTEPPDEFNHVVQGGDYGFPAVTGTPPPGSLTTGPVIELPEHICPVGFAFDTGNAMTGFQNQVFLSSWGGWGPTPVGKIKQAQLHQDSTGAWRMHIWDFLENCGKPLDTCIGPGGELYFTVQTATFQWPLGVHRVVPTYGVAVKLSGTPEPGNVVTATIHAPTKPGNLYILAASLGQGPFPTPLGNLGLTFDFVFNLSVSPNPFFTFGVLAPLNGSGVSAGTDTIFIPALPALSGVSLYFATVLIDPAFGISAVSPSARMVIL